MEQENAPTMNNSSVELHVEDDGEGVQAKCIIVTFVVLGIIIYLIGTFYFFAIGNGLRKRP